jgi:glycerol-3-phosphate O-acyltransferase
MTQTVAVPLWLLVLILAFAAVAALTHVFVPPVRWFFRRRMERLVARLNTRLHRKIEPWKLMRRQDMIVRLVHDPGVMEAVVEHAQQTGTPESVVFAQAKAHAREIVPAFSATVYFGVAMRAARRLTRLLYRVRIGALDAALERIDPKATVVFVMNHRSNMDYVLITWLVSNRLAISYAVGEWARVWPLSRLIRAMGAYFIRRNSGDPLYRRVLARYVQMMTAEGMTQAVFPEGGLSLDGRIGPARMGLLSYIVQGAEAGSRDVVFVPVGLGYDRVVEDKVLTDAAASGTRRFRARPLAVAFEALRLLWRKGRGRFDGFGTAAVGFGAPLSLRELRAAEPDGGVDVERLGARLMAAIGRAVPVVPVPLVAAALAEGAAPRAEILARMDRLAQRLQAAGVVLRIHPDGLAATLDEALAALSARGLLAQGAQIAPAEGAGALLAFYAAPVLQQAETGRNPAPAATRQT